MVDHTVSRITVLQVPTCICTSYRHLSILPAVDGFGRQKQSLGRFVHKNSLKTGFQNLVPKALFCLFGRLCGPLECPVSIFFDFGSILASFLLPAGPVFATFASMLALICGFFRNLLDSPEHQKVCHTLSHMMYHVAVAVIDD